MPRTAPAGPMHSTHPPLLERLRGPADADAWGRFVRLYTPLLVHWCRRLGVAGPDAPDLVQDVLLVVFRDRPGFEYDPGRSFRGWLFGVARSTPGRTFPALRGSPSGRPLHDGLSRPADPAGRGGPATAGTRPAVARQLDRGRFHAESAAGANRCGRRCGRTADDFVSVRRPCGGSGIVACTRPSKSRARPAETDPLIPLALEPDVKAEHPGHRCDALAVDAAAGPAGHLGGHEAALA